MEVISRGSLLRFDRTLAVSEQTALILATKRSSLFEGRIQPNREIFHGIPRKSSPRAPARTSMAGLSGMEERWTEGNWSIFRERPHRMRKLRSKTRRTCSSRPVGQKIYIPKTLIQGICVQRVKRTEVAARTLQLGEVCSAFLRVSCALDSNNNLVGPK